MKTYSLNNRVMDGMIGWYGSKLLAGKTFLTVTQLIYLMYKLAYMSSY